MSNQESLQRINARSIIQSGISEIVMQVVKENIILAPVTTTTDLHADIMYGIQTMIYALTKTQLVS